MKQYDMNIINQYVNDGRLTYQCHPIFPLKIYKYSIETQYKKQWDEITLAARGLVLDEQGFAYTNPIPKFFNIEEINLPGMPILPSDLSYKIFDKIDGSCILVFFYNENRIVCTLGSFESEQAKMAEYLLNTKYSIVSKNLQPGNTYIFEIIF